VSLSALVALAATAVLLVALVVLHLLPTGLSPAHNPVSQYALTPFKIGYVIAALAAAVAGAASALALAPVGRAGVTVVLLWIFAVARALIPLFPMDPPGGAPSPRGRAHRLLAIAAFATVTAAAFTAISPLMAGGFRWLGGISMAAGIVMAIGAIGVLVGASSPQLRRVFGLTERLIYLGFIAWFAALAIGLLAPHV